MKFINKFKSYNFNSRKNSNIKFIILHYTALKNTDEAIKFLCSKKNAVSSHYLVSQNGLIYNLVSDSKRAWHAGVSKWNDDEDLNSQSIGIELDFSYKYQNNIYSKKMLISLKHLIIFLKKKHKIKSKNILGHSDIAPFRKKDPGPKFPWKLFAYKNIIFYPKTNSILDLISLEKWFKINGFSSRKNISLFILTYIGYDANLTKKNKKLFKKIIVAYQCRYIQSNITGKNDDITFKHLLRHYISLVLTKT